MNAAELHALLSKIPKADRREIEVMVARAKDAGPPIASPAEDSSGWNYPVRRAERQNAVVLSLRWVAENDPC